ncbi:MAG: tocopherol cyclase family protein [Herbinix sp.]|nr:tocopherol cyclase family protein [Herbinix sp.]
MYRINKLFNPDIFQGKYKKKRYFEGWYFKITDSKAEQSYAIIPGISIGAWDTHAFIQVLDTDNRVSYFHYDISDFQFNENKFEIMIGDNYFSKSRIRLNIVGKEISLQGDLYFCDIMEFPKTLFRPGVMGPFLYNPSMECYHDILSIQHDIIGHLKISGKTVDFSEGIGYIEKNWGSSMPKSWIWFQSNHFQPDDVSLFLSVAKIPCMWGSFNGFMSLLRYKDRIFLFTTYNGSWIRKLYYNKNRLRVTIRDCRFRLEISVTYPEGGTIKAPVNGQMCRSIVESVNAVVKVRFSDRTGNVLYEGIGTNGGIEIVE